jgi:hypothetical protein
VKEEIYVQFISDELFFNFLTILSTIIASINEEDLTLQLLIWIDKDYSVIQVGIEKSASGNV